MKVCYIAGKMRGIKWYNFPAFGRAKAMLIEKGYGVISPADMDIKAGFDAMTLPEDYDWNLIPEHFDFQKCVNRDIQAVKDCDAIYMLNGWETSTGAKAEIALAEWLGKEIMYEEQSEVIIVDADTGAAKGSKLARFDLIPQRPLWLLAELYGQGAKKYSENNWRGGYKWSLSFAAAQRHLNKFWDGENVDKETGVPHPINATFHCLALTEYIVTHPEKDDRYSG